MTDNGKIVGTLVERYQGMQQEGIVERAMTLPNLQRPPGIKNLQLPILSPYGRYCKLNFIIYLSSLSSDTTYHDVAHKMVCKNTYLIYLFDITNNLKSSKITKRMLFFCL